MVVSKQSVSLAPEILAAMQARSEGNLSGTISKHLSRYIEALRRERTALRDQLSAEEIGLLCDVCNGSLFEAHTIPLLYAEVKDSLADGYAEKWQVDGPALVTKLRALSYIQDAALVDAIERWWSGPYAAERPSYADVLK